MSCAAFKKKKSGATSLCEESGPIPRKAASVVRRRRFLLCLCGCPLRHAILVSTLPYTSNILPYLCCLFLHVEIDLTIFLMCFFDIRPGYGATLQLLSPANYTTSSLEPYKRAVTRDFPKDDRSLSNHTRFGAFGDRS